MRGIRHVTHARAAGLAGGANRVRVSLSVAFSMLDFSPLLGYDQSIFLLPSDLGSVLGYCYRLRLRPQRNYHKVLRSLLGSSTLLGSYLTGYFLLVT